MDAQTKIIRYSFDLVGLLDNPNLENLLYCYSEYISKFVEGSSTNETYLSQFVIEFKKTIGRVNLKKKFINEITSLVNSMLGGNISLIFDGYIKYYNGESKETNMSPSNFIKTDNILLKIFDEVNLITLAIFDLDINMNAIKYSENMLNVIAKYNREEF